jgi:hypothetical protein
MIMTCELVLKTALCRVDNYLFFQELRKEYNWTYMAEVGVLVWMLFAQRFSDIFITVHLNCLFHHL